MDKKSKKGLNLKELETRLDDALEKETKESLSEWLNSKREKAAEKWVFDTNGNKWSNNDDTAGDNYGSFIEGSKWTEKEMFTKEDLKEAFKAGRKKTSRLTWSDEYIDEWKYTFKEWFNKLKKKK